MAKKRIFSLDAETNGLYGQAFSVGAVVVDDNEFSDIGEVARFVGRCPIEEDIDPWVEENVLPQMREIVENYSSYEQLLSAFIAFYKEHVLVEGEWGPTPDAGVDVIVHCGCPVEARLFIDAVEMGLLGTFEGPLPLKDVGTLPGIGASVDGYNAEHEIAPDQAEFAGGTHNPLYDSAAAAAAYIHWMQAHGFGR